LPEQLQIPSDVEKPISGERAGRPEAAAVWCILALAVFGILLLFRNHIITEIAPYPARYHDQASYLLRAYRTWNEIQRAGTLRTMALIPSESSPNTVIFPAAAALLFPMTGASRLGALTLGYLSFVAWILAVYLSVGWLSGDRCAALISVGLLLLSSSPFSGAGGIDDFRPDWVAACLYGVFACLLVRSRGLRCIRWSIVTGIVAVGLILIRPFTLSYIAGILLTVAIAALLRPLAASPPRERLSGRHFAGIAIVATLTLVSAFGVLWPRRHELYDYYIIGHITSSSGGIRAVRNQVAGLGTYLTFYVRSILTCHPGPAFFTAALGLLLAALETRRRLEHSSVAALNPSGRPAFRLTGFAPPVLAAFAVPFLILTVDVDKSSAVGGVFVAPLLMGFVLLVLRILPPALGNGVFSRRRRLVLSVAFLIAGVLFQYSRFRCVRLTVAGREENAAISALHEAVVKESVARGWDSPIISSDRVTAAFFADALSVSAVERHGILLAFRQGLGLDIRKPLEQQALETLKGSGFVLITIAEPGGRPRYPFDIGMAALGPLETYLRGTHRRIGTFVIDMWETQLFERTEP
jgi:hypothetical protein